MLGLIQWNERLIVVRTIVRLLGPLLDDNSLGISRAAWQLWIYVILPIASPWQAPLAIMKVAPAHIASYGLSASLLNRLQDLSGLVRSLPLPGRFAQRARREASLLAVSPEPACTSPGQSTQYK